ncbi:ferritin family protein [bacterium]|nr:ferritin family protein [bacterium]
MEALDFAMKMEKDGEAYYRDLATKCGSKGLANILSRLADEEVKHYNIFKRWKEGKAEYTPSNLFAEVKNVFEEMAEKGESFDFDESHEAYYRKAQELEKGSEDLYREKSEEVEDEKEKGILLHIADEEHRHYILLENIIEMIKRPDRWLEDAEWNNLEEY